MAAKPKPEGESFVSRLFDEVRGKDDGGEYITFTGQQAEPTYLQPKLFFRTGITVVDVLMGYGRNGGLGSGRMTELYGKNRTGKSALATELAHQALIDHPDVHVMYLDMERALTADRLVPYPMFKSSRFTIACPSSLDKACSIVNKVLVRAREHGAKMFLVFDSVASMRAESELTAKDGKVVMMAQSQMFSKELPKIRGTLSKTDSHLLMLNQMRAAQNGASKPGAPPPDHTPGGQAIQFYADYRIKTSAIGKFGLATGKVLKEGASPSGFQSKIASIKNKSGIPDRSVMVPLVYFPSQGHRSGLSELWSLFHAFRDTNVMQMRSGGNYSLDGKDWFPRIGWADYLRSHTTPDGYTGPVPEAIEKWRDKILSETYGSDSLPEDEDGGEGEAEQEAEE